MQVFSPAMASNLSNFIVHLTSTEKLSLVKFIKENQETLMGKLGPGNTNLTRNAKWTEIYEELKSKGTVLKDLAHFRKDVWGNIRKAAIAKKDNNNKTGAKAVEITEIDKIALEIVSPTYTDGLGLPDHARSFLHDEDFNPDASFMSSVTQPTSRLIATPMGPPLPPQNTRTSTPVDSETEEEKLTPSSGIPKNKKRKRGPPTSLLFDDNYKALKVNKMKMDAEEQQLRMQLLQCQIAESTQKLEESRKRTDFFAKAGIALDQQGANFIIQVPNENHSEIIA